MGFRDALRQADQFITSPLVARGFEREARGIYTFPFGGAVTGWLGLNVSPAGDAADLYPFVGVDDREIEALVCQLGGSPVHGHTVVVQLGYLMPGERATAWTFTADASAGREAADALAAAVAQYAIPFYAANADRIALAGSVAKHSIEEDQWLRLPVAYTLLGDVCAAERVLEQAAVAIGDDDSDAARNLRDFIENCERWIRAGR
jgi:hypothetical protein